MDPEDRIRLVYRSCNLNLEELSVSYMVNAEDFFPSSPLTSH